MVSNTALLTFTIITYHDKITKFLMIEFYNRINYCLGLGSTVRDRNPKLPGLNKRKVSISYKIQKAVQGWYYGCTFRLRCFIPSSVFTFQVIEGDCSTSLLHSWSSSRRQKGSMFHLEHCLLIFMTSTWFYSVSSITSTDSIV